MSNHDKNTFNNGMTLGLMIGIGVTIADVHPVAQPIAGMFIILIAVCMYIGETGNPFKTK